MPLSFAKYTRHTGRQKVVFINLVQRCFQEYSSKYALSSRGGGTGDINTAYWHDIESNVAPEVHVKRFTSKKIRIHKLQEVFLLFLRRRVPETTRSGTTSNFTPPESRDLRRGRKPCTLGEATRDPLQCARSDSQQEEGGVAGCFWSWSRRNGSKGLCLEYVWRIYVSPPCHAQRTLVGADTSKYIDVVEQTKVQFGQFGRVQHRWFMEHRWI